MLDQGPVWQLACGDLVARQWGDECVLLNPISGHTHVLDLVGSRIVHSLRERPRQRAELHAMVGELLDIDDRDLVAANVDAILADFDEAGLIERCTA